MSSEPGEPQALVVCCVLVTGAGQGWGPLTKA
jgi:hypothetical protein